MLGFTRDFDVPLCDRLTEQIICAHRDRGILSRQIVAAVGSDVHREGGQFVVTDADCLIPRFIFAIVSAAPNLDGVLTKADVLGNFPIGAGHTEPRSLDGCGEGESLLFVFNTECHRHLCDGVLGPVLQQRANMHYLSGLVQRLVGGGEESWADNEVHRVRSLAHDLPFARNHLQARRRTPISLPRNLELELGVTVTVGHGRQFKDCIFIVRF